MPLSVTYYEKGCTLGDVDSCAKLDASIESGRSTFDPAMVERVLTKSCEANQASGCFALGMRLVRQFKGLDWADSEAGKKAVPLMHKACAALRPTERGEARAACNYHTCINWKADWASSAPLAACKLVGLHTRSDGVVDPAPAVAAHRTGTPAAGTSGASAPGAGAPQVDHYRQSVQRQEQQRFDSQARDNNYRVRPAGR